MALPLNSFAGVVPENAAELAAAHKPYDATLPPLPAGDLVKVHMTLKDITLEIAPGVKYNTWAFDGHGAPAGRPRPGGPDGGDDADERWRDPALDRLPRGPHRAERGLQGCRSRRLFHLPLQGRRPRRLHVPLRHQARAGAHRERHVRRDRRPAEGGLPPVDNEYVLVASEWYLNADGITKPASLDMAKARSMSPDWTTFNGYANQYVNHPLTANPGETTRFYVVAAGPTLDSNFHVVGTIFDRAWVNGDMTSPPQVGVQTVIVPAGGGGVFDVKIDDEGLYPFVSHAFAHVDLGQVGLLKVGNPKGTMSH